MTTSPRISVAIALLNEEQVIPELVRRLSDVLDAIPGGPHEVVFVDDGSSDSTFELIAAAAERDPRIVGLSLAQLRPPGSFSAGLESATGDVVVLMDGDLQDPPEEIPKFLVAYEDGFDVVYAQRVNRKEGWVLRLCYFLFYRLIAALATVRLPVDSGEFALLSRPVVDQLNSMPERNRYSRGMRTWVGFRQIGIRVERSARAGGKPGYTPTKLLRLALDGIFAFSTAPLRAASIFGGIAMTAGHGLRGLCRMGSARLR